MQILAAVIEHLDIYSMDRNVLTWQSTSSGISLLFPLQFTEDVVICAYTEQ